MKVHKITLYVVDHDDLGQHEVCLMLENTKYPNRCMNPYVLDVDTRDAGLWSDKHPLNDTRTARREIVRLFS